MPQNPKLNKQLSQLPDSPGVYIMRDAKGVIVYVGKATSLKSRVRSYFQPGGNKSPKTVAQMKVVDSLEWVVVSSPQEALVLECNLIKEHNPKYNIMLRDDKHYPYLMVTTNEQYPRLVVVRQTKNDGNRYFGPYVSSSAMKMTQQLIGKIFPLRSCSNHAFHSRKRPCLNAHIEKCLAPCGGRVDKKEYNEMVKQVIWFLEGKTNNILKDLQIKMEQASEELRFEDAARYRDQIQAVRQVQSSQQMDVGTENRDMAAVLRQKGIAVAMVFFVREGKVVGKDHFFLDNTSDSTMPQLLSAFLSSYYSGVDFMPPEICLNGEAEDMKELTKYLTAKRGGKVQLSVPQIGDKRKLLDLVEQNAKIILDREIEEQVYKKVSQTEALEELKTALDLEKIPYRIECYDNSHWQGTYTVNSMVTFCGGQPNKALYRHMRIKNPTNGDDFMAMREALSRRLARGLREREMLKNGELKPEEAPMAQWPDLILIDGGKGQLSAVVDILETLQLKIPVFSLAKREDEIFRPHCSQPIMLDKRSPALQLLKRLSDEAHRFGITYQRKLREKGQKESALDNIPGIGPARRTALLKTFGSLAGIMEATEEQLALVPAMNRKAAADLYSYLHKKS
ncbi:MAG: excinuclease ABC subunit UvrC [Bacillota bacterium]|jgi:excinuclease ABC subunit C